MDYRKQLKFTQKLLNNFRVNFRLISRSLPESIEPMSEPDLSLRKILHCNLDFQQLIDSLNAYCLPNIIYQLHDILMCDYLLFRLPDVKEPVFGYIGPYVTSPISGEKILKLADTYHVTPANLKQLEKFFNDIPLIPDEHVISTIIYTLGESMWGSSDNFSIKKSSDFFLDNPGPISIPLDSQETEEPLLAMHILEDRYEIQRNLMQAVSNGQVHKAEFALANLSNRQMEIRVKDMLRNRKNYLIILNTSLRIAAENGAVHPVHIDNISSDYARKIEALTSEAAADALSKEMVRKYSFLVKNHSLKKYSLLVRKVITLIDFDLTADLSLKTQAQHLSVNPSYLSTLFKKETGVTLTDYVNRKRIDHAIFLLNTTNMPIQLIAQHCGVPDVNYFTKTFKKIIGITPKEYRKTVSSNFPPVTN